MHPRVISYYALLGILLFFATADFAILPLLTWIMPRNWAFKLCDLLWVGMIGAQAGLQSIWIVLAPLGLAKRLLSGIGAGLILVGAFALAWAICVYSQAGRGPPEYWSAVLIYVCLAGPLLGARRFGYRLVWGNPRTRGGR